MIYGVYCVRDVKTGYLQPSYDLNDASAMRNFEHACNLSDTLLYSHGSDYSLYKIADFDTETGEIIPIDKKLIMEGFNHEK